MKVRLIAFTAIGAAIGIFLNIDSAQALQRTWNNTGTDYNTGANWDGTAPGTGDVGFFNTAETTQPNLSASVSNAGIYFSGTGSSGYDITSSDTSVKFTLTGIGSTGAGGTNNNAAAIRSEITSGINTIDAPIVLGAGVAQIQVFFQASGGTLVVNGALSNTNAITSLDLKGTGTIELNGSNTSLTAALVRINDAGTTVVLGNDNALGTGTFIFATSGTIEAGGGFRTIANNVNLNAGTATIGGTNDITFSGNVTVNATPTRTITVTNTGETAFSGNLFLSGDNTNSRTLTVNGTGVVNVDGVVANNNSGNTTASNFIKSGTNTVIFNNTNTYTGTTSVTGGNLLVNGNESAATGAVSVTGAASILGGTGTVGGATTIGSATQAGNITGAANTTIGTLVLASSLTFGGASGNLATYLVDLGAGANNSDKLAIGGALDLTSAFDQISFNGTPDGTSSYVLATFASLLGGNHFDTVTNLPEGYQLVYNTNDIELDPTAVPEPSTWVIGALVAASLLLAQRRRFARRANVVA